MKFRWVFFFTFYSFLGLALDREEIPFQKALLFNSDSNEVTGSQFKLIQNRNKDRVSSFDLIETFSPILCVSAPCPQIPDKISHYKILFKKRMSCGEVKYFGKLEKGEGGKWMEILDRSENSCEEIPLGKWVVKVGNKKELKKYSGNPVSYELNCAEINQNQLCAMIFMPISCQATQYLGQALIPSLDYSGANPCFARMQMDILACERGLDPDKFLDSDIKCEFSQ